MNKGNKWITDGQKPMPTTVDDVAVTFTMRGGQVGWFDMLSTGTYPKTGVLEYGHWEE